MIRLLARILGFFAILLALFLGVGIILPGTWATERSAILHAPPEEVFPWVNRAGGWEEWTLWPDAGRYVEGPSEGVGAVRGWDDPNYGAGRFTIIASQPDRSMAYRVEVEDGAITVLGSLVLDDLGDSTRVTWREEGDFGLNPLLGYAARGMERSQGAQLEQGLARLEALLKGESPQ